ncbi:hypothetical protein C8R45DRAFT_946417 [Mycena sanguinolenta]|nr:hypothetical protein C8R45DRAFT_946417 [Mycena sanguinolenta]
MVILTLLGLERNAERYHEGNVPLIYIVDHRQLKSNKLDQGTSNCVRHRWENMGIKKRKRRIAESGIWPVTTSRRAECEAGSSGRLNRDDAYFCLICARGDESRRSQNSLEGISEWVGSSRDGWYKPGSKKQHSRRMVTAGPRTLICALVSVRHYQVPCFSQYGGGAPASTKIDRMKALQLLPTGSRGRDVSEIGIKEVDSDSGRGTAGRGQE